jgi:hypothetical protein
MYKWVVDGKKLRGNDRSIVSRQFVLGIPSATEQNEATFKMMIYAKTLKDGKGGQSFKMAKGQATLQLKCEQFMGGINECKLALKFSIGDGVQGDGQNSGYPFKIVHHDFSQSAACTCSDWNFGRVVDEASQTFVVTVEVIG